MSFEMLVGIWIARMVDVSLRESDEDDLAIRIRAMVDPLSEMFTDRRLASDLPYDVDSGDPVSDSEGANRENAQSLDW